MTVMENKDTLKCQEYTQAGGYHEIEIDASGWIGTEPGEGFKAWIGSIGLREYPSVSVGRDSDASLRVYIQTEDGNRWYAMADIGDLNECFMVLFPTQSDLLCLLPTLIMTASIDSMGFRIEQMERAVRKMFRSEHGHDPDDVCQRCDPETVKEIAERRRARQERDRQKKEQKTP